MARGVDHDATSWKENWKEEEDFFPCKSIPVEATSSPLNPFATSTINQMSETPFVSPPAKKMHQKTRVALSPNQGFYAKRISVTNDLKMLPIP